MIICKHSLGLGRSINTFAVRPGSKQKINLSENYCFPGNFLNSYPWVGQPTNKETYLTLNSNNKITGFDRLENNTPNVDHNNNNQNFLDTTTRTNYPLSVSLATQSSTGICGKLRSCFFKIFGFGQKYDVDLSTDAIDKDAEEK